MSEENSLGIVRIRVGMGVSITGTECNGRVQINVVSRVVSSNSLHGRSQLPIAWHLEIRRRDQPYDTL